MSVFDCVATYHENPWTCGVTRWNQRLAQELGVPMVNVFARKFLRFRSPLVSIKWEEVDDECDLEDQLKERREIQETQESRLIHCGDGVQWQRPDREPLWVWCPGTVPVYSRHIVEPSSDRLSVLCFGMAKKLQPEHFRALGGLLDNDSRASLIHVSTAIHEGTSLDAQFTAAYEELSTVFNGRTQFLGWLADAAIGTVLSQAHLFAAFFPNGVRANNTTVFAALASGCPVITNLSKSSPPWFVHGETMLDVKQCEAIPGSVELEAIGKRGQAMVNERYSWKKLVEVLNA